MAILKTTMDFGILSLVIIFQNQYCLTGRTLFNVLSFTKQTRLSSYSLIISPTVYMPYPVLKVVTWLATQNYKAGP